MNTDVYPVRLSCGHYHDAEGNCDECKSFGPSPDPWLVAGGDVNLDRLAETRLYRQMKYRNWKHLSA